MTTFEDVAYKVKTAAETAGKKTSALVDLGRMKLKASEMEHELSFLLEGLGRLVFDAKQAGDDVSAQVDECVVQIAAKQQELTALRDKIDESRNRIRCRRCGTMNVDDAVYCKNCGAKLVEE